MVLQNTINNQQYQEYPNSKNAASGSEAKRHQAAALERRTPRGGFPPKPNAAISSEAESSSVALRRSASDALPEIPGDHNKDKNRSSKIGEDVTDYTRY